EPTCTGRSPVLFTWSVQVRRPALSSMASPSKKYSPGIMVASLNDRLVHGDELGAVGKGCLDLNFADHLGNAVHHIGAGQNGAARAHDLSDALAVAGQFQELAGNERDGFRVVQFHT